MYSRSSGKGRPEAYLFLPLPHAVPDLASRYGRVIESAGYDDGTRGAARVRYRYYRTVVFP